MVFQLILEIARLFTNLRNKESDHVVDLERRLIGLLLTYISPMAYKNDRFNLHEKYFLLRSLLLI